jgi:hypothetical protein
MATHRVADPADARMKVDVKGGWHYTASQLLAGGFDLRNTAARLGHSGGGATTLRPYADPVPEVDRRAAAYLAQLTAGPATPSELDLAVRHIGVGIFAGRPTPTPNVRPDSRARVFGACRGPPT